MVMVETIIITIVIIIITTVISMGEFWRLTDRAHTTPPPPCQSCELRPSLSQSLIRITIGIRIAYHCKCLQKTVISELLLKNGFDRQWLKWCVYGLRGLVHM